MVTVQSKVREKVSQAFEEKSQKTVVIEKQFLHIFVIKPQQLKHEEKELNPYRNSANEKVSLYVKGKKTYHLI